MPDANGNFTEEERQWFAQFAAMTPEQQAAVRSQEAAARPDPTTGITAATATPTPSNDAANRAIYADLAAYLAEMGLGELLSVSGDGRPSGWLWDQITSGLDSQAQLAIALESTPVFERRYGIIKDLRKRAVAGEPVQVPTVAEWRDYEQTTAAIMRQAGLPSWFYDSFTDTHDLMRQGLSPSELEQRLGGAWERVQNTDPAIRRAFEEFYGVSGDAGLAAFYLDKSHTVAKLDQYSRTVYTAGTGRTVGVDIDRQIAERIAQSPLSESAIVSNLNDVATLEGSGIFREGITEGDNFTAEREGVNATFFGDGGARARIERRTLARQANERSSTGGAALTQSGLTGTTSA